MTEPTKPSLWQQVYDRLVEYGVPVKADAEGRVLAEDILAAISSLKTAAPAAPPRAAALPSKVVNAGDPRRNPLLAAARRSQPARVVAATRAEGSAPTLFSGGDLPPFTASGIDPAALLSVPWQARHSMAQAPTTAAAYAITAGFAGLDAESADAHAQIAYGRHPANRDYERRMQGWLAAGQSDDEVFTSLFGDTKMTS